MSQVPNLNKLNKKRESWTGRKGRNSSCFLLPRDIYIEGTTELGKPEVVGIDHLKSQDIE